LEQTFEAFKALSGQLADTQRTVVDAIKKYQDDLTQVISVGGEDHDAMQSLAGLDSVVLTVSTYQLCCR